MRRSGIITNRRRCCAGIARRAAFVAATALLGLSCVRPAIAGGHFEVARSSEFVSTITAAQLEPSMVDRLQRVILLRDPNTRVVLLGTALLGGLAGVVGVFMLLRRRSLVGDVVGHAALPGIAGAFLIAEVLHPGAGKSLPILLTGAFATGLCGALCVMLIDRYSRVKSDAALAIVLSASYGVGAVLLSIVQRTSSGAAAGLATYLSGKTASLLAADVWVFAGATAVILAITLLLFKELTLLCFDTEFAAASGWPVLLLDALLITLVAAVTIIGMQSVGLLLVVATLITPAAAARFWTDDVRRLAVIAGALGAGSAVIGIVLSAIFPNVAAGATIVLVAGALFAVSLLLGRRRGFLWRRWEHRQLERRIARDDLIRAIYEQTERRGAVLDGQAPAITLASVRSSRSWSAPHVARLVRWAKSAGLAAAAGEGEIRLTEEGVITGRRLVRNHRLWELYLIQHADIAAVHVDHTADLIEHIVDPEIVEELEQILEHRDRRHEVPDSPHVIGVT
jgi:manganese/zinc/iron transport system permease protein